MWRREVLISICVLVLPPLCCAEAGSSPPSVSTVTVPTSTEPDIIPFDPADYPRLMMRELRKQNPCRPDRLSDDQFSIALAYQGAVRKTPEERFALVASWAAAVGDPEAAGVYGNEVSFTDEKKRYWLTVPEGILPHFRVDLQPGDRVIVYLVQIGCVGRSSVFVIEDFSELDQTKEEIGDTIIMGPGRGLPAAVDVNYS